VKNQYFGDRRDFFKYDLLLDLAECLSKPRLTFIPMLTPNDGTGEGNVIGYECGARRQDLFDALRRAINARQRDIGALREVLPPCGVEFLLYRDAETFNNATRTEYFKNIPTDWLSRAVVFFDPDIGLQTGTLGYMRVNGCDKYLMYAELENVAARAADDSVLVVYQHLQRNATKRTGDIGGRLRDLATHLATPSVWAVQWADLAFLVAVRDVALAIRIARRLREHAGKHGGILFGNHGQPVESAFDDGTQGGSVLSVSEHVVSTPMANAPKMTTCEVQSGTAWKLISVSEALDRNERNGRCVECKMPVRAHRLANNGMAAHFEHLTRNPSCSFSDKRLSSNGVAHSDAQISRASTPPRRDVPVLPKASESAASEPHVVKPLSVDDLADLRRKLTVLLNSIDSGGGMQREGIRSRINRLSREGGALPRHVAALMTTITEMRNSAEYESKVLSASECAVVRHAWQAIQEWAESVRRA